MRYLLAIILIFSASYAYAEILDKKYMSEGTSGEMLFRGVDVINEEGLYRVDDMASGYHVYIVTARSGTQIHAVPFRKDK